MPCSSIGPFSVLVLEKVTNATNLQRKDVKVSAPCSVEQQFWYQEWTSALKPGGFFPVREWLANFQLTSLWYRHAFPLLSLAENKTILLQGDQKKNHLNYLFIRALYLHNILLFNMHTALFGSLWEGNEKQKLIVVGMAGLSTFRVAGTILIFRTGMLVNYSSSKTFTSDTVWLKALVYWLQYQLMATSFTEPLYKYKEKDPSWKKKSYKQSS